MERTCLGDGGLSIQFLDRWVSAAKVLQGSQIRRIDQDLQQKEDRKRKRVRRSPLYTMREKRKQRDSRHSNIIRELGASRGGGGRGTSLIFPWLIRPRSRMTMETKKTEDQLEKHDTRARSNHTRIWRGKQGKLSEKRYLAPLRRPNDNQE